MVPGVKPYFQVWRRDSYVKLKPHFLMRGYTSLSMMGTRVRIKMGFTICTRTKRNTQLGNMMWTHCVQGWYRNHHAPASDPAAESVFPVGTKSNKTSSLNAIITVSINQWMRELLYFIMQSQFYSILNLYTNSDYLVQLTKAPSMVVAWRVQREPCRPNHNSNYFLRHCIIGNWLFNILIIMARCGKCTQSTH